MFLYYFLRIVLRHLLTELAGGVEPGIADDPGNAKHQTADGNSQDLHVPRSARKGNEPQDNPCKTEDEAEEETGKQSVGGDGADRLMTGS